LQRKRWFLIVAALAALALGLSACGGDDDDDGGGAGTTTAAGEGISVGLVTDTGGVDDRGFNENSINGLERAEEDFGLETRIYVSESADDYLPNLTAAAEDGHDLVIAVGFLLAPATIEVAKKFPDVNFAGVDHFYGGEGCDKAKTCEEVNALGMQYPSEESGYIAGVIAALMTKSNTVSTVGGKKIPPVDNWIAGFQQAVKDTKAGVKTLNAYSDDFVDQAKCKEIALDQINQGSDVVFQVAGQCGLGALDAACEQDVFAIGVDADQSGAGSCVITSALKPLEDSVYQTIRAANEGEFTGGGNQYFGVKQLPEAELLAPFTDDVPSNVRNAADDAKRQIIGGEIDPPSALK
jgi:basic membrane protein A